MKWTRISGFLFCTLALAPLSVTRALAGDDRIDRPIRTVAPLEIPHATNLELDSRARKRNRKPDNVETMDFLDLAPGLTPVTWPKNSDMRARIMTPQLQRTPVVGWIASNLYRSKKDTGWCLEVDPGEGEYLVFYRLNLK